MEYNVRIVTIPKPRLNRIFFAAASAALALAMSGTFMLNRLHAAAPAISDRDITRAIEADLLYDDAVSAHLIDVETRDGIVILAGSVDTMLAEEKALKIAEHIKGVRAVIDRLAVRPVQRPDNDLRRDVRLALLLDPAVDLEKVGFKVNAGVVRLYGAVDSLAEKQIAGQAVKSVAGVRDIANAIRVAYSGTRSDSDIAAGIKRLLQLDPLIDGDMIRVSVEDGNVTLTGKVGSVAEKTRACNKAWGSGIISVDADGLEVDWVHGDPLRRTGAPPRPGDSELADAVRMVLENDPRVAPFDLDVSVENAEVTLSGTVDNLKAKRSAAQDARYTTGVEGVTNRIRLRMDGCPPDRELEQSIRDAFARDAVLSIDRVAVQVRNRTAYLYGTVFTRHARKHADDIASMVPGIAVVKNNIEVRGSQAWKRDTEIRDDIQQQLFWSPFLDSDSITVLVKDGEATLTGTVGSRVEVEIALQNAFEGGAHKVNNRLLVQGQKNYLPLYLDLLKNPDWPPPYPNYGYPPYLPPVPEPPLIP